MKKEHIIGIIVLAAIALVVLAFTPPPAPRQSAATGGEGKLDGNPTDFSAGGRLSFAEGSVLIFAYQEADGTGIAAPLTFDGLSACTDIGGSVPCLALDVGTDIPLDGQRAIVEGLRKESGILVRKIMLLPEDAEAIVPGTGHTFLTWAQATEFIRSCGPAQVTQTRMLDVFLEFADGSRLRAVEPAFGAVETPLAEAAAGCGTIPFVSE
ncbi:MAG TPA: hypothetical protein VHO23_02760 [Candidatus Paceibacterota bacterium]|nr:hypothetical protein [Candidatus Paceibacterota bacterium]